MTNSEFKRYYFKDHEQWWIGVFDNLQLINNGLAVNAGFSIDWVVGTGKEDTTSALDFGPCKHLYWVRPGNGELVRLHDYGPQIVGVLSEAEGAIKLAIDRERLWVQIPGGINSYVLNGLHPLRQLRRDRQILDMAGDRSDGVWWLEGGDVMGAKLYHADRYGEVVSDPISLSMPLTQAALAVSCCGRKIIILDYEVPEAGRNADPCGKEKASWCIIIIDCENNPDPLIFDSLGTIDSAFKPQKLAVDFDNNIQLIDPVTAWVWTLNFEGVLFSRDKLELPENSVKGIAANNHIVLATSEGIFHLNSAEMTGAQDKERASTFITPTLISPDGTPHGWQRADIEIVLPAGTTLQVKCAATSDSSGISRINSILNGGGSAAKNAIEQLNQQLSWREADTVIYAGTDIDDGVTRLRYPLHQIDETYLWLSFSFYTPPGRKPPSIKTLAVYYPNISYLRYLPAVYQENSTSVKQLRSFLAIFETLFGDLDTVIGQLPGNIDPNTAPDSWLPFLLRWLGLPSPDTLSFQTRRKLLQAAPSLLAARGTQQALQQLLEIIVAEDSGGNVTIEIDDMAKRLLPWILQAKGRKTAARLGTDTLVVAQHPPAFRLGKARLGSAKGVPLGVGRADLKQILAQRTGELIIKIISGENISKGLEPIISIFLPYFVPAHCRYRLEFLSTPKQTWQQRLDVDLRLNDGENFRLGRETVLGGFRLPVTAMGEIILDRNALLDGGLHLN